MNINLNQKRLKQWNYFVAQKKNRQRKIDNAKLYIPVVTLSINNNIKVLENIKPRFIRKISWNKYKVWSDITIKNNNLDYMIDPTFRKIHRLLVLSLKNSYSYPTGLSIDKYYKSLVEEKQTRNN